MRISDWSSDVCSSDLLLHEVVAADALDAAVDRQFALLLKAGPVASAQAKSLVRDVAWLRDRHAFDVAHADLIARQRVAPEGRDGLWALSDKGWAAWVGMCVMVGRTKCSDREGV